LSYSKTATGVAGPGGSAAFCYQITIVNDGQDALNNVVVTDNKLTLPAGSFPTTLQVGQSATAFVQGHWTPAQSPVQNTVTVSGTGATSSTSVSATDSAAATVLPISVACTVVLSAPAIDTDGNLTDNHLLLPTSAAGTTLSGGFVLTVQNTGQATVKVNTTEVLGGNITLSGCVDSAKNPVDPTVPYNLAPSQSATFTCDIVLGANACPGPDTIQVTVTGTAVATTTAPCIFDSAGNAAKTAPSSCNGTIQCTSPCPECVNPVLGLGAASDCSVLELGPSSVSITGPAGGILGNICIAPNGKLSMSGSEFIEGIVKLGAGATFNNSSSGVVGGVVHNVDLSAEIAAAYAANTTDAALPCSQTFQTLDGKAVKTITGVSGVNVICVQNISLSGTQILLTGPSDAIFIFNVTGKFVLTGGGLGPQIRVDTNAGIKPSAVLYNIIGQGPDVAFSGGGGGVNCCAAIVDGTILAPYRKINLSPGLVNGEIISGMNISIVSGSSVRCPPCP
jgi:hypothetical protein